MRIRTCISVTALVVALLVFVAILSRLRSGEEGVRVKIPAESLALRESDKVPSQDEDLSDEISATLPPDDFSAANEALTILEEESRALRFADGGRATQRSRVENIAGESVEELIASLAAWDDLMSAETSNPRPGSLGNPQSDSHIVTHLFRVRKLLEWGRKDRDLIVRKMEETIRSVLESWPSAYRGERGLWEANPGGFSKSRPTAHDIVRGQGLVALYVLAELGSYDSLPLMSAAFTAQQKWTEEVPVEQYYHISPTALTPAMHLYAMHRLVSTFPPESLSPRARAAHEEYMRWTDEHVPPAKKYQGVASSSLDDESDPLYIFTDPAGTRAQNEPKMQLTKYPYRFRDGEHFHKSESEWPYLVDRAKTWAAMIEEFAVLAFPNAEPWPSITVERLLATP